VPTEADFTRTVTGATHKSGFYLGTSLANSSNDASGSHFSNRNSKSVGSRQFYRSKSTVCGVSKISLTRVSSSGMHTCVGLLMRLHRCLVTYGFFRGGGGILLSGVSQSYCCDLQVSLSVISGFEPRIILIKHEGFRPVTKQMAGHDPCYLCLIYFFSPYLETNLKLLSLAK
jgi:hypothetical protein